MRVADGFSKLTKTTAILSCRRVEGTSGNHIARKTRFELDLMDAALGPSSFAMAFGLPSCRPVRWLKLVGGLIGLRSDIVCAVGISPCPRRISRRRTASVLF